MQLQVLISSSSAFRGNSPFWGIFATAFLHLLALTILGLVQFKTQKCSHVFFGGADAAQSSLQCAGRLCDAAESLERCFILW